MNKTLNPNMVGIALPFRETLALAKKHGFDALDFNVASLYKERISLDSKSIRSACTEQGIKFECCSGLIPWCLNGSEEEWTEGMVDIEAKAAFASDCGISRTIIVMLPFHKELHFDAHFDLCVKRLRLLSNALTPKGIRVGIEYVSQQTRRAVSPYPFIYSMDGTLALLKAANSGNLGLLLDSYHWHCAGESCLDIKALNEQNVIVVHIADAPQKPLAEQMATVRELPGQGVADLKSFIAALNETGYKGPLMCEPFHNAFESMGPDSIAAIVSKSIDSIWDKE